APFLGPYSPWQSEQAPPFPRTPCALRRPFPTTPGMTARCRAVPGRPLVCSNPTPSRPPQGAGFSPRAAYVGSGLRDQSHRVPAAITKWQARLPIQATCSGAMANGIRASRFTSYDGYNGCRPRTP
ncbi:hypothetical protein Taro_050989, partial [Colocasia esculenta]|nr:hypothetical protein [Colocasia esculenta]